MIPYERRGQMIFWMLLLVLWMFVYAFIIDPNATMWDRAVAKLKDKQSEVKNE